jgi:hypothetical protein
MTKWPNGQMAKWPNGQIEGVKGHKVIPRPTALRAVGKKFMVYLQHYFNCSTFSDLSDFRNYYFAIKLEKLFGRKNRTLDNS